MTFLWWSRYTDFLSLPPPRQSFRHNRIIIISLESPFCFLFDISRCPVSQLFPALPPPYICPPPPPKLCFSAVNRRQSLDGEFPRLCLSHCRSFAYGIVGQETWPTLWRATSKWLSGMSCISWLFVVLPV